MIRPVVQGEEGGGAVKRAARKVGEATADNGQVLPMVGN